MFQIFSYPFDVESLRAKTAPESPWKGLYQVLLTTQKAAKLHSAWAKEDSTWHLVLYKCWRCSDQID